MKQIYSFKSSVLAKQAVIETNPQAYPFKKATPVPAEPKTVLIEDSEDMAEFLAAVIVLAAIVVVLVWLAELTMPGWTISTQEVLNGYH